ncbi:MAG TPA: alpha/beta hydrolase domain-containing protein [Gemmatimonadaceae bacterium]|nr:alpha/beta hydrolase domain-containing protein [Gemmatimonadaceae bacterium]
MARVRLIVVTVAAHSLILAAAAATHAQVTRIVIDSVVSPAFGGASYGTAGQYETIAGRAFGELDPSDRRNHIITDLELAPRNSRGRVEYVATFYIVKPIDLSKSSHFVWNDVPNRGGRITINVAERNLGDIGLSTGWQGDQSGRTTPRTGVDYVIVPVARQLDGSPVTGPVIGRIVNASGVDSRPLIVYQNPVPYRPRTLDTRAATVTTHAWETADGRVGGVSAVPGTDWAWARCTADHPFPGVPDSTQICLKRGFDPKMLYQAAFTARDPYVLGIGFAAFRDVATFFGTQTQDASGARNPLAGGVSWMAARGVSQSGNFLRAFLELGFNERLDGRRLFDGAWPIIAGRRISLNTRFAMPDGILNLYEPGSEGPQWWSAWPDTARGNPVAGILDRCSSSHTCPRVFEHFGAAEVWGLKLSPEWVGTDALADIPLPSNVRRYYIPGTAHGGGAGGFSTQPLRPPVCPSADYGVGTLPNDPVPHTQTVNALREHFRDWIMKDVEPPRSVWPRIADGTLVSATKEAMGFPTIPGLSATAPTGLINPLLDYDFGPEFNRVDGSGVPSTIPPAIRRALPMKAPRVDADGNELGGVPVVLHDAPLGTYVGWNITASGFFAGRECSYAAGMIPFARTRSERVANGDPRPSVEERYRDHAGYVQAVRVAAAHAVQRGFLLQRDADALIAEAEASDVLR